MSYNHNENCNELEAALGIPRAEMFDYSNLDPYKVVENYFQFCQTNLSENSEQFNIHPARIFIRPSMEVNAGARKWNDYYLIRINFGTIPTVFRLFTDHRSIFDEERLKMFIELHKGLDDFLDFLMFQLSTQFTFYHEKAHLIQLSPIADVWLEESYTGLNPEDEPYDQKRHLYEFDADLHASTCVTFHILEYWKRLPEKLKTDNNLGLLASLAISGIFSYFIFLMQKYTTMYYKASTHPHPLIRVSYVMDNMIKAMENNLEKRDIFDPKLILNNAFAITEALFEKAGTNWVLDFVKVFMKESKNIEEYIVTVLWEEAKKLPELTINRDIKF